ncbi:MAG: hypothetical protein ACU0CO_14605 [Shimia sp.]
MTTQNDVKATAKSALDDTKAAARDAAQQAQSTAKAKAEEHKQTVASEVGNVASALRTARDEMREGSPQERIVGEIAGTLADVSDGIAGKDVGDMVADVSAFARRNPLVFLGSAALVGFAAAQFMKASDPAKRGGHAPQANPTTPPAHPAGTAPLATPAVATTHEPVPDHVGEPHTKPVSPSVPS